jgi:hypothetical protein
MIVIATDVDQIDGTIVVFAGFEEATERPVRFAADRRPAQAIIEAVLAGEDEIRCSVETWQVLG